MMPKVILSKEFKGAKDGQKKWEANVSFILGLIVVSVYIFTRKKEPSLQMLGERRVTM